MTQTLDKELKTLMRGGAVDAGPFTWGQNDNLGISTKRIHSVLGLNTDNPDLDVVLELAQRLLGAYGYKSDTLISSNHFEGGLPRWFIPSGGRLVRGAGTDTVNGNYLADGDDFVKSPYTLEAFVDAMAVEGSVNDATVGIHLRDGDLNERPYYKKDNPFNEISLSWDGAWKLKFTTDVDYFSNDDVPTPDLAANWQADLGKNDPPTVRRATLADSGITASVVTWRIVDGDDNVVYSNATNSITPPETGWVVGTGDADAPTVLEGFDVSSYVASVVGSVKNDTQLIQLMLERGFLEDFNNAKNDRARLAAVLATLAK